MAVLNVKNFPDALYKKLKARAKREHRSVAQEVTHLLSDALETAKPLSILELKGLGKEHTNRLFPARARPILAAQVVLRQILTRSLNGVRPNGGGPLEAFPGALVALYKLTTPTTAIAAVVTNRGQSKFS